MLAVPEESEARRGSSGASTRSSTRSLPARPRLGQAERLRMATDRLPTRQELLSEIGWLSRLVDALARDRNRLSGLAAAMAVELQEGRR